MNRLIDHAAIAAADGVRDRTHAADREAQQALSSARAALASAHRAADAVARDGGDAEGAELVVQSAERALRIAERRAAATGALAADAPAVHRRAVGEAHRRAALDAIRRRVAACAAHEAALAAVERAKSDFQAATQALLDSANAGCQIRGALDAPRVLPTAQRERGYWAANAVVFEETAQ
jgi:hypothetical protein